jgi:putative transposase
MTREIVATFQKLYDANVSAALISKVTDAVKDHVVEWQNRRLEAIYPIVYLDWSFIWQLCKLQKNGQYPFEIGALL